MPSSARRSLTPSTSARANPGRRRPRKETPWYNEQLAKQYTEYDVAKANAALDKAFPQKDGSGMRLGPDGKRIAFVIEVAPGPGGTEWPDVVKLVVGYWEKVGIAAQLKNEERSLLYTRKAANDHDAVVWGGDGGSRDSILELRWYFPYSNESNFAEAWQAWYNDPSGKGSPVPPEEPPAPVKQQMQLYQQLNATGDEAKQIDLMKQILQIAADQFYCIGISLPANGYGIVKNNFHNVPKSLPNAGLPYPNPAPTNPCQYFIE
jgi:peptide/nickel transport system substrate-binding protein